MYITSERRLDDGVVERRFTLGDIPGILWTPASAPAPLILVGHPGGLHKMYPRLAGRARCYAAEYGFAAAAIELPGSGDRPRSAAAEQARDDLRRALEAGEPVDEIVDALVLPLVEKAVPEWQATLDALLSLPVDAFGSEEKTLHDNLGGHTGVPSFELDAGARFFARHLR